MSTIDKILGLLTPAECISCGAEGDLLCGYCLSRLARVPQRCYRCLLPSKNSLTCAICRRHSDLDQVFAGTPYAGNAKELVARLKFSGARHAVVGMARHLAPHMSAVDRRAIIVPVPTATWRARGRGFDQALLLASELSRQTGLSYVDCLARTGRTRQVGASREGRFRQLEGAFRTKGIPRQADVILLDDVLTTGATLESAARTIKSAGAGSIIGLVFAQA